MPGRIRTTILIILILFVAGRNGYSETYFEEKRYNVDSLLQLLQNAAGADRIRLLCLVAGQYRIGEAEKSIGFAEEAYELSLETGEPGLELLATYSLGQAYHHAGDYPKAIRYSLDARDLALKLHDTVMYYRNAHIIGLSYLYSNNPDLFINTVWEVLRYVENWKDPLRQFELQIRLGWTYMMTGHYREALPYYYKAAACADSTTLVIPAKIVLNYSHMIRCYLNIANYDSARYFIDLCGKVCHEHGIDFTEYGYKYLSEYYFAKGYYDSALVVCKVMVDSSRIKGDFYFQASKLSEMGKIYRLQGKTELAVSAFKEVVEMAEWIIENKVCCIDRDRNFDQYFTPEQSVPDWEERGGLRYLIRGHSNLYEIYKSLGNYRLALTHLEAVNEATNRVRELDRKKDVIEVNTRYETERKESQILLLTSENEISTLKLRQSRYLLLALAGFILLVIFVSLLMIRQSRIRTLHEKTILEQRLFRAQMNPHFLFNTLANIQSYMLEKDNARADHYLGRFSKLIRNILENTSKESISLDQEISTIENYLTIQKNRYEDKFDYIIEVDDDLDRAETFIPPMLTQPFIENAIEHGIKPLKGKGLIRIKISSFPKTSPNKPKILSSYLPTVLSSSRPPVLSSHSLILLEITDNGVGRKAAEKIEQQQPGKHKPLATSITMERLKVLGRSVNRKVRRKVKLEIRDLLDDEGNPAGTRVLITIPIFNP